MKVLWRLLALLVPLGVPVESPGQELFLLDAVEVRTFEHGYRVLEAPASGAAVRKVVPEGASVNIAAWLDTVEGRFYLTDWSLERRRRGESHFWIQANAPMTAGAGDWRERLVVFDEPVELHAGAGFRVLAEPDPGAAVLKTTNEPATFEVAGSVVTEGLTFYVSAWSMERYRSGAATTLNWVLPFGAVEGGMAKGVPVPLPVQPEPPSDPMKDLWWTLWDEQVTPYMILEAGRELLPFLVEREGAEAPRALATELVLGLVEWELGQRAPGRMRLDHAIPKLIDWFQTHDLSTEAGSEESEPYRIGWVMKAQIAEDLVEALILRERIAEARMLVERFGPEWAEGHRPVIFALRLAEGVDPLGAEMEELVNSIEEYDRFLVVRLLEEKGHEAAAAKLAKGWGMWSPGLRDDPGAVQALLDSSGDPAERALALYRLGQIAAAQPLWDEAMESTIWSIDFGLEHQDLYSGVPASFGLARDLGVPESFLEPALERTVETLRRASNRILAGGLGDLAETFLDADLPAQAGSARHTADAAIALKGCMLERAIFERKIEGLLSRPDCAARIERLRELEGEYRSTFADRDDDPSRGEAIEAGLDAVLGELADLSGDPGLRRRSHRVTSLEVEEALPERAALVEFVSYKRGYAAVVLRRGLAPVFLDITDHPTMESLVETLRGCLLPVPEETRGEGELDEAFLVTARALYNRIAAPIEAVVGEDTEELILSLDGDLHFLPLTALVAPDGRFWCEQRMLRFVNSGRDLVVDDSPGIGPGERRAVLFGAPVFFVGGDRGAAPEESSRSLRAALRQGDCVAVKDLAEGLADLPGTAAEVAGLREILAAGGYACEVFGGTQANEGNLRRVEAPEILHLATHGLCLPGLVAPSPGGGKTLVTDPMWLSSLALTGACDAYAKWDATGVVPDGEEGIVFASEVGRMRLHGTDLVVLSACETGLGLSTRNHGVQGLKTALHEAGAENLLLSLWPVSDEATVDFMKAFFRRYVADTDPGRADPGRADPGRASLEAEVEMFDRLRSEGSSARECAALAAPFVLTGGRWRQ